ncbi:MAG: hypothetical protein KJ583_06490 [Nanoarchaeota archaeon]|nr:hypothetical protein [Nanoarchaeota archaeon]MBU1269248.1 hypothetical protein [Nanoarchaeota archaeon]MBU1604934.1 hypothetical protein [Nanoarchaeota archaeon]MBU2443497.1 hypothetical protein [Nanoarchaeota archaeon]
MKEEIIQKVWDYLESKKIDEPVFSDRIKSQLSDSYQGVLNLFVPWGPKYNYVEKGITVGLPEKQTIAELKCLVDFFKENNYKPNLFLMFADSYGTEINSLPVDVVKGYFSNLEKYVGDSLDCKPLWWSKIKDSKRYFELKNDVEKNFFDYVDKDVYEDNLMTAKKFKGGADSAKIYSLERVTEGLLIEELYSPIKLSLVKKEKDALDGPLKRLYVIESRKPWMR